MKLVPPPLLYLLCRRPSNRLGWVARLPVDTGG
jgi:hypothetical protein